MKKALVIILVSMFITGCSSTSAKDEEIIFVTKQQPIEVAYGEEVDLTSSDYITESNGEVFANTILDTENPGIQAIEYTVILGDKKEIKTVNFLVNNQDSKRGIYSYRSYKCLNENEDLYFNSSEVSIVLNPDGNHDDELLNFAIGDGNKVYYGTFVKISDNIYSFTITDYNGIYTEEYENYHNLKNKPVFSEQVDGYFKIDKNYFYFINEDMSIEEMKEYESSTYCIYQR